MTTTHVQHVARWNLDDNPNALHFSPDSRLLYAQDFHHIHIWSIPEFVEQPKYSIESAEIGVCQFLTSPERVALFYTDYNASTGIHHIVIRDLQSFNVISTTDISIDRYGMQKKLFNRAGDRFLMQDCLDGPAWQLFEFPSGKWLRSFDLAVAKDVAFSPDESQLWAVGGVDEPDGFRGHLNVFDSQTGQLLNCLPAADKQYYSGIRVTPDGNAVVIIRGKSLAILDSSTLKEKAIVEIPIPWQMYQPSIAMTPDSRQFAISSDSDIGIYIVDCHHWEVVDWLPGHPDSCVRCLAYSPCGRYLASGSEDQEVKVWQVAA